MCGLCMGFGVHIGLINNYIENEEIGGKSVKILLYLYKFTIILCIHVCYCSVCTMLLMFCGALLEMASHQGGTTSFRSCVIITCHRWS